MGLVIGREVNKSTAHVFILYSDPGTNRQVGTALLPGGEPADEIRWFLRPLTGKDSLAISNAMMQMRHGKGQSKAAARLMSGTVTRIRVIRSTVAVEGLVHPDGRPIERISEEIYDRLPEWLIEAVHAEILKINGIEAGEEEADEGE